MVVQVEFLESQVQKLQLAVLLHLTEQAFQLSTFSMVVLAPRDCKAMPVLGQLSGIKDDIVSTFRWLCTMVRCFSYNEQYQRYIFRKTKT